jgi:hypothetical protein
MQMLGRRSMLLVGARLLGSVADRTAFGQAADASKGPYFARIVATTTIHSTYQCNQFECTVASVPLAQQPVSMDYVWQSSFKTNHGCRAAGTR